MSSDGEPIVPSVVNNDETHRQSSHKRRRRHHSSSSSSGSDATEEDHEPLPPPKRQRQRQRQGQSQQQQQRHRRASRATRNYRCLLNQDIHDAAVSAASASTTDPTGYHHHDYDYNQGYDGGSDYDHAANAAPPPPLAPSQIGASRWSAAEKRAYFSALARRGRDDVGGIAARIVGPPGKSALEVAAYTQLLQRGLAHERQQQRRQRRQPRALEDTAQEQQQQLGQPGLPEQQGEGQLGQRARRRMRQREQTWGQPRGRPELQGQQGQPGQMTQLGPPVQRRYALLTVADMPAAREISAACCAALDRAAARLEKRLQREAVMAAQRRWGDCWVLTRETARETARAIEAELARGEGGSDVNANDGTDGGADNGDGGEEGGDGAASDNGADGGSDGGGGGDGDAINRKDGNNAAAPRSLVSRVPAAELLKLESWLELSARVFMNDAELSSGRKDATVADDEDEDDNNSNTDDDNGDSDDSGGENESPAMHYTAFDDFCRLAVSVTQRLVQATLFQALSRCRAMDATTAAATAGTAGAARTGGAMAATGDGDGEQRQQQHFPHAFAVEADDVRGACAVLGMAPDAAQYWARLPRRCGLHVYRTVAELNSAAANSHQKSQGKTKSDMKTVYDKAKEKKKREKMMTTAASQLAAAGAERRPPLPMSYDEVEAVLGGLRSAVVPLAAATAASASATARTKMGAVRRAGTAAPANEPAADAAYGNGDDSSSNSTHASESGQSVAGEGHGVGRGEDQGGDDDESDVDDVDNLKRRHSRQLAPSSPSQPPTSSFASPSSESYIDGENNGDKNYNHNNDDDGDDDNDMSEFVDDDQNDSALSNAASDADDPDGGEEEGNGDDDDDDDDDNDEEDYDVPSAPFRSRNARTLAQRRAKRQAQAAEDELMEAMDMRASAIEERRLWDILGVAARVPLSVAAAASSTSARELLPNMQLGQPQLAPPTLPSDGGAVNWRERTVYWSEWETQGPSSTQ